MSLRDLLGLGPSSWVDCPLPNGSVRLPRDLCRKAIAKVQSEAPVTLVLGNRVPSGGMYLDRVGLGTRFTTGGGAPSTSTTMGLPAWVCAAAAAFGVACNPAAIVAAGLGYLIGQGGDDRDSSSGGGGCPEGWGVGPSGVCEAPGSPGNVSTDPGGGASAAGMLGLPSFPSIVVGERLNAMGQTTLIRQCPRGSGTVLGKDNRCYPKGILPRKLRKWIPTPRPPVTREDAVAIRRAAAAKGRVKRLAEAVEFKVTKR